MSRGTIAIKFDCNYNDTNFSTTEELYPRYVFFSIAFTYFVLNLSGSIFAKKTALCLP